MLTRPITTTLVALGIAVLPGLAAAADLTVYICGTEKVALELGQGQRHCCYSLNLCRNLCQLAKESNGQLHLNLTTSYCHLPEELHPAVQ